jgi:hypothetical protein
MSIIHPPTLGLPSGLFPYGVPINILYAFHLSPSHSVATYINKIYLKNVNITIFTQITLTECFLPFSSGALVQ